jgi:hypothetical protein
MIEEYPLRGNREGQRRGQAIATVMMGSCVQTPTGRVGPGAQAHQAATDG